MKRNFLKHLLLLPFVIVIVLSTFYLIFLLSDKDPSKPPSALINQNLPNFIAKDLFSNNKIISSNDLNNKLVIINFFASWCIPCKEEHPLFNYLKKKKTNIFMLGVNHKDKKEDALNFLSVNGNPYNIVISDNNGDIAFEFGVFGLPETFLVSQSGKIIYKHTGPLTKKVIKDEILPLLE